MSRRKNIPVQEVFKEWENDPAFRAEYDLLEDEFTLATALIKARDAAHMTRKTLRKPWEPRRRRLPALKAESPSPQRGLCDASPRRPVCASG